MKIGEYLIQAIRRTGTRHVFGIPAALAVQLAAPAGWRNGAWSITPAGPSGWEEGWRRSE